MLFTYDDSDVENCLANRTLTFLGDSTARQLFWAVARKLDHQRARNASLTTNKHANQTFSGERAVVQFVWDPFLNESHSLDILETSQDSTRPYRDTLVVGTGLWHAKYLNESYLSAFMEAIERKIPTRSERPTLGPGNVTNSSMFSPSLNALFLPVRTSDELYHDVNGSNHLTPERASALNEILSHGAPTHGYKFLQGYSNMIAGSSLAFQKDGVHVSDMVASNEAEVLMNYICNNVIDKPSRRSHAYCCTSPVKTNPVQKLLLFAGSCATSYHMLSSFSSMRPINLFRRDLRPFASAPGLIGAVATVSLAAIYCFVADRTMIFTRAPKVVDSGMFICQTALSLLVGLATCKPTDPGVIHPRDRVATNQRPRQILSRQQTEEWKGWMQVVILLYHCFGMSKVLWAYQFVRLLVASYLFMTGFSHSMYFIATNDFSLQRASNVLSRTNLLNVILAFVMGTQYDLYYFPALSSLWFLIVWITIPKAAADGVDLHRILFRISISATITVFITISKNGFQALLGAADNLDLPIPKIDGHEFLFRFSLDAYIVYVGMLAAVLCSRYGGDWQRISGSVSLVAPLTRRAITAFAAGVLVGYAVFCCRFANKYHYNKWHPFASPLPVVAYLVLRNSHDTLLQSHSRLFAWFGRCSLETFVLQYHIWLAADSQGLLRLGLMTDPAQGRSNFWADMLEPVFTSMAFLWLSHAVSTGLPVIVKSLVGEPDNNQSLTRWEVQNKGGSCPGFQSRPSRYGLKAKVITCLLGLWTLNLLWRYLE
jgi:hypothetical protein